MNRADPGPGPPPRRFWRDIARRIAARAVSITLLVLLRVAEGLFRLAATLFFQRLLSRRGARLMLGASRRLERLSLAVLRNRMRRQRGRTEDHDRRKGGDHRMRRELARFRMETPLLWVAMALLCTAIFVADTITNLEIAVAVLYVSVVLLSVWTARPRAIAAVGAGCVALTVLSYALTPAGAVHAGLANCGLSLVAIGATTYLAVRIEAAERAVRDAQADLAHMSRVTTMGELTSSIAHEVNQPLAAIVANGNAAVRWLAASPPNQDEARSALDRIIKDADRAGEVISRVRRIVTRTPPSQDRVDMAEVILEALALTRSELRKCHVVLRTEMASDLPSPIGDRIQLQQVVLNFVVNAIEAMGEVDPGGRELLVSAATDGKRLTVSVRDTGVGLPPADAERVFEAFYTTKPTGMGMGLAVSRSIIEAHGGKVYMAPNYPRGTVFGFVLPLAAGKEG